MLWNSCAWLLGSELQTYQCFGLTGPRCVSLEAPLKYSLSNDAREVSRPGRCVVGASWSSHACDETPRGVSCARFFSKRMANETIMYCVRGAVSACVRSKSLAASDCVHACPVYVEQVGSPIDNWPLYCSWAINPRVSRSTGKVIMRPSLG